MCNPQCRGYVAGDGQDWKNRRQTVTTVRRRGQEKTVGESTGKQMLVSLHVKNMALIKEVEVEFGRGLNIMTGETGAGKSIVIGAVNIALGTGNFRDYVPEDADYALVELVFVTDNPAVRRKMLAQELPFEDGEVIITRRYRGGRSSSKINGETVSVSFVRELAAELIDIHGQHEHQSLLYGDRQLAILDVYGKEQILPAREKVRKAYQEYRDYVDQLKALDMDEEQRNREKAFLEFEINEIEEAALIPGEDETLEDRYRKLSNARRIMETAQMVRGMTGYEQGAADMTGNALKEFSRIADYDKDLAPLQEALVEIDSLLSDFCRDLSSYMDSLTFDEETFFETEKRLDLINSLKAKYGQTIHEILSYQKEQQEKLEKLQRFEENFRLLKEKLMQAEKILEEASHELSEIRKKYSKQLDEKIIEGLKELNFEDVDFSIRFDRRKNYTDNGYDAVEYEISTNPGESRKPLGQIVSGGELSRIMLAIKAILADKDQIDTLIFDEIDTGISGRTAQKVSEKMAVIGQHRQVLCITHLPQIAAMADTHFEIEKHVEGTETITQIHPLEGEESVRELARLLGGAQITPAVLGNAREMKELAQQQKNTRLK